MLRLRKILLSNYTYLIISLITILISSIRINIKPKLYYKNGNYKIEGKVIEYNIDNDLLSITIKSKELLIGTYKFKTQKEATNFSENIDPYDKLLLYVEIKTPEKNKTRNLFNYKDYLKHQNIYHTMKINKYKKIKSNKNIFIKLINYLKQRNKNPYIKALILGDKSYIKKEVLNSYRDNGISHLLAISGMHISILSGIIMKLLKRLNDNKKVFVASLFLLFYLTLTGFSASIIRGILFFILFKINTIYYFYISKRNLFILIVSITLLINPNYIFDTGFIYSFSISGALLLTTNFIQDKNYFKSLLKTSIVSILISIPISLYNFSSINILSIFYNLIFVPYLTYILFPSSLINFITNTNILYPHLALIMEKTSLILSKIKLLTFNFYKFEIVFYLIYLIVVLLIFVNKKNNKIMIIILFVILIIHYNYPNIINEKYVEIIDVGQGDSILLKDKDITLIDTGGKRQNKNYIKKQSIVETTTIPLMKSLGINKINNLIITHGDFDHMGEAINLIENFKVENVIFNCGTLNYLERKLISLLKQKNINYYKCIKELEIGTNKLYFLNTRNYDNENDNSVVIYTKINNYKFLFMGDAGIRREKDIIETYNLNNIDFLKAGHHGSDTSSSKYFINQIKPKYSLISVGKNNRYGHPKDEVLKTLSNSKIYRTDIDGSIEIKLNKNGYKIRTCPP